MIQLSPREVNSISVSKLDLGLGEKLYEGDKIQIDTTMIGGGIITGEVVWNNDSTLSRLEWGLWTDKGYHATDFLGEIKML